MGCDVFGSDSAGSNAQAASVNLDEVLRQPVTPPPTPIVDAKANGRKAAPPAPTNASTPVTEGNLAEMIRRRQQEAAAKPDALGGVRAALTEAEETAASIAASREDVAEQVTAASPPITTTQATIGSPPSTSNGSADPLVAEYADKLTRCKTENGVAGLGQKAELDSRMAEDQLQKVRAILNPWTLYRQVTNTDSGSDTLEDVQYAQKVGVCPMVYWNRDQHSWRSAPPAGWEKVASNFQIDEYAECSSYDEHATFAALGFGVGVSNSSFWGGGHSTTGAEYNADGSISGPNSWGEAWGEAGWYTMPMAHWKRGFNEGFSQVVVLSVKYSGPYSGGAGAGHEHVA